MASFSQESTLNASTHVSGRDKQHPENIYAKNVKGDTVFILESESGARGYYCLGCNNEMVAARRKRTDYKAYFRHHYVGTPPDRKCTYSDETYRHALAKSIFQESKLIKVPRLLKYHPTDTNALAIKLRNAEFLEAFRVEVELPFFEDDDGEVCWSKQASFKKDHLLIQPDVTFFDAEDNPILLIEIVATHKIDDGKKSKIRRLGINTVQITIPKDSPEAIADCLKSSQNIKWVFHNDEAKSDYFQLSKLNPETVLYPDAEQRKLLGETFTCREAEINNLIRSIELCLQSEQYKGIRGNLDSEISKVEGFTEQQEDQLRKAEEEIEKEALSSLENDRKTFVALSRELEAKKKLWKDDIIIREVLLKEKILKLSDKSQILDEATKKAYQLLRLNQSLLRNRQDQLKEKQELLRERSKWKDLTSLKSKETSNHFLKMQDAFQASLSDLKKKWQVILNQELEKASAASKNLAIQQEPYMIAFKEKKMTLLNNWAKKKENLQKQSNQVKLNLETGYQNYENEHTTKLRNDLLKVIPNCPLELKECFLNGNQYEILRRKNIFQEELEKLYKRLETDLTKISWKGSVDRFIELANQA